MKGKKNIIVTGGAGFVGSHLCRRLIEEGHQVTCVDNLYTGRKENITSLLKNPNFRLILHDITLPFQENLVIDEIYNLACPASPVHYQRDPIGTTKVSVMGILQMLELATKSKAKLLQASTSEVYGSPTVHPQPESYWGNVNPTGVRSCYDEGKRCAESLCFSFYRLYGTRIKVARIFNTYGPLMDLHDGRVVSNFVVQALGNKPITVYGKGQQTRSFCYVDDMVEGLIRLMKSSDEFTGPVNLGNAGEFTVLELAKKTIFLTGSKSSIVFLDLPSDDPELRRPELALAQEKLGWHPRVTLDEGLRRTIDYFASALALEIQR